MTQKIYGLVQDNQDGSASIVWFRNPEIALGLTDPTSDSFNESFNLNETHFTEVLEFPDNVNLEGCGFYFADNDYAPGSNELSIG